MQKVKLLLALVAAGLTACQTPPTGHIKEIPGARITWYTNHEDCYGSKTASGGRAQEGRTVAAHRDFAFGTTLVIPALRPLVGSAVFTVEDRGSAVEAKRASTGGEYVFDVYLRARNAREGRRRIRRLGAVLTHADVFVR